MGKPSRKTATRTDEPSGRSTNQTKGNLLENVVAGLYEAPDLSVERRVFLPSIGNPTRKREIDVLITGRLAGYPARIAIECKNYKDPVGIEKIGGFIDKLEDVGIPPQYGIFVSVNGYERGAIDRANQAGVRTLMLDGLTPERLEAEIREALQSVVYLLLVVTEVEITSGIEIDPWRLFWFRDGDGKLCGGLPDIVWAMWRKGELPTELGKHEITIDVPEGWNWERGEIIPNSATVRFEVRGAVITDTGTAEGFVLWDAGTGTVDRAKIKGSFPLVAGRCPSLGSAQRTG